MLTGPESSGKTQLASALASALGLYCVPEFARTYLAHLGRPYEREDLAPIARGQRAWERWYTEQSTRAGHSALVLDTDWTVLHVWEWYKYAPTSPWTEWVWPSGYGQPQLADWYGLCAPDFPWNPDPLREHPHERVTLFERYEALLKERGARYTILRGSHEARLAEALEHCSPTQGAR